MIWSAVLDDRINHGRDNTPVNQYFKKLRDNTVYDHVLAGIKRRYSNPFLYPVDNEAKDDDIEVADEVITDVPDKIDDITDDDEANTSSDSLTIPLSTALSMLNDDNDVFGGGGGGVVGGWRLQDHDEDVEDGEVPVLNIREDYDQVNIQGRD